MTSQDELFVFILDLFLFFLLSVISTERLSSIAPVNTWTTTIQVMPPLGP